MKKILRGFVEGYFAMSLIIYISTDLILGKALNLLFYPSTYPFIFAVFYLAYCFDKKGLKENDSN